jgi:[ribosomal protein S5]-alanine N-acetyltransferase
MIKSADFPVLDTERLILRKISAKDIAVVFEGLSHPEVIRYYGVSYITIEATAAQMQFYDDLLANHTGIWWAVCLKDSGAMIGACGFNHLQRQHRKAETGYWLLPSYQGHGYMLEALQAIIPYAFGHLQLHRIEAVIETGNTASIALAQKSGFRHEGTQQDAEIKDGRFISLHLFALLNS